MVRIMRMAAGRIARISGLPCGIGVALLVAGLASGVASGAARSRSDQPEQAGQAPAAAPAPAPSKPTTVPLAQFAADALVRMALIDLRNQDAPTAEDYKIAGRLIDMALALEPEDVELMRRRLEAAFNGQEDEVVERLHRRILSKDPGDTVAQLALVTAQIGKVQNAKDRLALYERFLGKEGEKLDPSVRSRLALDAALILRETGDYPGFESRLKQSLKLDQTNKDAATLALNYYAEASGDELQTFNLLINLLLADPFDPDTHRAIRDALVSAGAFKQALKFAETADRLSPVTKLEEDRRARSMNTLVLQWLNEGSQSVVDLLEKDLASQRERAAAEIEKAKTAREGLGMEISSLPKPEDVRLYLPADKVRALAADIVGDREKLTAAMDDVGKSALYKADNLLDKTKRDVLLSDEDALAESASIRTELALMRLLLGVDADKVIEDRKTMDVASGYDPAKLEAVDAWLKLRGGDAEGARAAMEALSDAEPLKPLGLAAVAELAGEREKAAEYYRLVAVNSGGQPLGAWALGRFRAVKGDPNAKLSDQSDAIGQAADSIPSWVKRMIEDPRSFMRVSARASTTTLNAAGRLGITLKIRNLAPVPLGAGPDLPVSTRLLISPQFERAMVAYKGLPPEIALVDRRLRLNAGETLEVRIDPAVGMSGWLLQDSIGQTVRGRWRILQGFVAVGETVEVSSSSIPAETDSLIYAPMPESGLEPPALVERIRSCTSDELPALILSARAKLVAGTDQADALCGALVERYRSGTRLERMVMLTTLPPRSLAGSIETFDSAVKGEQDPELAALVVLTRVHDFADPALAAARGSTSGGLGEFAGWVAGRSSRKGSLIAGVWPKFSDAGVRVPHESGAGK
jgi:tetratricopeptide (TPR) repeat protein